LEESPAVRSSPETYVTRPAIAPFGRAGRFYARRNGRANLAACFGVAKAIMNELGHGTSPLNLF
jgi:hypothetical protein